jgi:ribonucleotide reductase alpha subunit
MNNSNEMFVKKRNGNLETVSFDKILNRMKNLGSYNGDELNINYTNLCMKIIDQLFDGIETSELDELTAQQCASMTTIHPDYGILASRILVSNHHKNTSKSFSKVMKQLYNFTDIHGIHHPKISQELYELVEKYGGKIDKMIDYSKDYELDYFGFKTLERSYLMKYNNVIIERPQHMWMRVSLGIHGKDLDKTKETYDLMSSKFFTHATPTLFNSGTPRPQMSSCYLIAMEDDSVKGIYNTMTECALISKYAGGIGLHIHNVRGEGTHIRGTNGNSNGIVPMLRAFNATARYIDQCILGQTYIYTTKGPMQIQDVYANDTEIFNSQGRNEIIENVLEHPYEGLMYKIYTTHSLEPLQITAEHPIYVLENQKKGTLFSVIKNRLDKKIIEPVWKDVKDLTTDDIILYKKPVYEIDDINISEDDCYMYGVILGDGYMLNNKTTGHITLHNETKKNILEFCEKYFNNKCVNYVITTENNTVRIRWNKTINLPFRYRDIYDINKEKYIHHKWLNLPLNKIKYIVKGLLDTDGCNNKELTFDSTSRNLIESMRYMLLRMGVLTSGYIRDRIGETHESTKGTITNKKISYVLRIPRTQEIHDLFGTDKPDNSFEKFFKYHNLLGSRINNIEKTTYSGTLYDLQMTNIHDYTIHNGLIHNGGGKRAGSFAMYIEPWHTDIEQFLQMKKNHGDEELRARDLFYALWIPDLFMERVRDNKDWTLMCPDKCKDLQNVYGDKFKELYEKYENEGKGNKTVKARKIWFDILDSQIETGTPYMLYKDTANKKSNQKNLGTIKSSNLCVAPETTVLTRYGNKEIKTLENKSIEVWNGNEWSQVLIRKTGINQKLITIKFNTGVKLDCTPYHRFYIEKDNNETLMIEAQELKKGMKIINYQLPICYGDNYIRNYNLEYYDNVYIEDVLNLGRKDDTYCFTEYKNHMGVFNGILTGQCSEIIEYSNEKETAVCNLASIGLPMFVRKPDTSFIDNITIYSKTDCVYCKLSKALLNKLNVKYEEINLDNNDERLDFYNKITKEESLENPINSVPQIYINNKRIGGYNELQLLLKPSFDYEKLHEVTKIITYNLNKVIDINFYPTEKTNRSNKLHRPIGIGIQGLADVFALMNLTFDCDEAKEINKKIFETIYHAALERSNEIAIERKELILQLQEQKDKWEYKNIVEWREKYNLKKNYEESDETKIERAYNDVCCQYISKHKRTLQTLEELKLLEIEELKLSKEHIGSYSSFEGCPASQGILQYDMWNVEETNNYDWSALKTSIMKHGLRNSLFIAPMPTASTSQILGNNECFEPFTSNIYNRRTLAGEFVIINKHLLRELIDLDLWNVDLKNLIIANKGSVQNIQEIPKIIRDKYKIVWEIPMMSLIDMSRDRGAYVCQSQSLNLWMENPSYEKLTSMHFYSWKQGLKTGIYYLRTKASASAQQFTIDPKLLNKLKKNNVEEDEGCLMCSG